MSIGKKIKKVRVQAGFTQKELAEKSGVAAVTIQQYERGVRQPKIEQLGKIANALGVKPSQLLDMPDGIEENDTINAISEFAKGEVNGVPNKELAEELLDEMEDVVSISDLNQEAQIYKAVELRIKKVLPQLSPEGLLEAAKRVEELAKIPDYRR